MAPVPLIVIVPCSSLVGSLLHNPKLGGTGHAHDSFSFPCDIQTAHKITTATPSQYVGDRFYPKPSPIMIFHKPPFPKITISL